MKSTGIQDLEYKFLCPISISIKTFESQPQRFLIFTRSWVIEPRKHHPKANQLWPSLDTEAKRNMPSPDVSSLSSNLFALVIPERSTSRQYSIIRSLLSATGSERQEFNSDTERASESLVQILIQVSNYLLIFNLYLVQLFIDV